MIGEWEKNCESVNEYIQKPESNVIGDVKRRPEAPEFSPGWRYWRLEPISGWGLASLNLAALKTEREAEPKANL